MGVEWFRREGARSGREPRFEWFGDQLEPTLLLRRRLSYRLDMIASLRRQLGEGVSGLACVNSEMHADDEVVLPFQVSHLVGHSISMALDALGMLELIVRDPSGSLRIPLVGNCPVAGVGPPCRLRTLVSQRLGMYISRVTHSEPEAGADAHERKRRVFSMRPRRWRDIPPPAPKPFRPGLTPLEFADSTRAMFYKDRNHLRAQRTRWAVGAIAIRLGALSLSASATIILGLSDLTGPAGWGFSLSAVVTLITALEPFFNFRSRWVSADEALAEWHKAEEDLAIYVETRPESELEMKDLIGFDDARRDVWGRFSQEWLSDRRSPGSKYTP